MKNLRSSVFFPVFILMLNTIWAGPVFSLTDNLEITGWADTIQSIRIHDPNNTLTSRARLRLETSGYLNEIYGFVSIDAEKNFKIKSETGLDLQEAWAEYASGKWDIRLGRQIVIWGKADGIRITDNISPPDYTESVTRDLDEIRMAVDAVKFRLLGENITTEFLFIPVFRAAVQPGEGNPWAITVDYPDTLEVSYLAPDEPDTGISDSEFAMKVSGYFSGMDWAASVFYTWDDDAVMFRDVIETGDTTQIVFKPQYKRMTVFGLECAVPWSDLVFRGETAFFSGRYFSAGYIFDNPAKKDSIKWLAGTDWYPGNDWTVTGQITGTKIFDHDPALYADSHELTATLNISKKILRQTITISNMVYYDISAQEYFNRFEVGWDASDSLNFSVGADIFEGDTGTYGQYEQNSQLWFKAKYSFQGQ
ncbi:MAG: hypothetical protein PVG39_01830 [Desulfobacteraceae bacterium]|jgi:hypothetical protein